MSLARVRSLIVVGVLLVAAVVSVVTALVRDTASGAVPGACAEGAPVADLTLPEGPDQVTVKVFNGSGRPGVADSLTTDFVNRRFRTEKPAKSKKKVDGVALLRFGPEGVGSAQLVRALFLGDAETQYEAKRKGKVVEVVVGGGFRQLATFTEANQSLAQLGEPELPPGACRA
jgi:hypothetical protein|nr:LytR C-terminal domain-containing protein [Actinoplanes friuliensis]